MVSLLQVRDLIALYGQADIALLSSQLNAPTALVNAMAEKLVSMGKIEKVDISACLTGTSCKDALRVMIALILCIKLNNTFILCHI